MSFFDNQVKAKRNSTLLVLLFVTCVISIIFAVYFALLVIWHTGMTSQGIPSTFDIRWWNGELFGWTTFIVLSVILAASALKVALISQGGRSIAEMLGGRLIQPNTNDAHEKRLLNVVEEMAIAAGIPVPPVYLLERENGINAFAAGYTTKDAVIGVTAGCLQTLNRDELQGVVAHEFSHIFNGDMRLNLRLVGLLFGILVLYVVGKAILRMAPRSRSSKADKGTGAILLTGLALVIIGWVGAFFARLIQAAVSRQREFLADASAIQFTRNPDSIGGALRKIGGWFSSSAIETPSAHEVSHFFFANGLVSGFFDLFATHPPLGERLKRIYPNFSGQFEELSPDYIAPIDESPDAPPMSRLVDPQVKVFGAREIVKQVGTVSKEHVQYARYLLDSLSPKLLELVRDPYGARGVLVCLLLDSDESIRARQLARLNSEGDELLIRDVTLVQSEVRFLGPEYRLPLASAVLPAMKALPPNLYKKFRKIAQALIQEDNKCSIFEYAIQRMLRRALDGEFFGVPPKKTHRSNVSSEMEDAASLILSSLACLGNSTKEDAERAFDAGASHLQISSSEINPSAASINTLDKSLSALESAPPHYKEQVLGACAECILADKKITTAEAELIRAVADGLECPLPPLILPATMAA